MHNSCCGLHKYRTVYPPRSRSLQRVAGRILIVLVGALCLPGQSPSQTVGWSTRAPLPEPRFSGAAGVINGIMYVVGGFRGTQGFNNSAVVEAYDPATNTWTTRTSIPTPRTNPATVTMGGKLYVFGGIKAGALDASEVEVYDPVTDTWSRRASMPWPSYLHCATTAAGKIYISGGFQISLSSKPRGGLQIYDPASDTWSTQTSFPDPHISSGICAMGYLAGKIFFVDMPFGVTVVYDPVTNVSNRIAPMPTQRSATGVSIGGELFLIGGAFKDSATSINLVEALDPISLTWRSVPSGPSARDGFMTASADNVLYVVGGVRSTGPLTVERLAVNDGLYG